MNADLVDTSDWLMANALSKNIDKTNFILIFFIYLFCFICNLIFLKTAWKENQCDTFHPELHIWKTLDFKLLPNILSAGQIKGFPKI